MNRNKLKRILMDNEYELRESKLLMDINEIEKYNESIYDANINALCELKENLNYLNEMNSILSIKSIEELDLYIYISI